MLKQFYIEQTRPCPWSPIIISTFHIVLSVSIKSFAFHSKSYAKRSYSYVIWNIHSEHNIIILACAGDYHLDEKKLK